MSYADYNEFIDRELQPEIVDTVVYKKLEPWMKYFTKPEIKAGDRITSRYRLAHTSNAASFDKTDVDVAPATQTLAKPHWTKTFVQGACEVHGIDMSNDKPSQSSIDEVAFQIKKESAKMIDVAIGLMYTQIKNDVDSSSVAYSTGALSRSTYPLLVSYEEDTDATITLAYMRNMIKDTTLNKQVSLSDYICMMEGSVFFTLKPLAAALHSWNLTGKAGKSEDMGHQDVANFEGLDIAPPTEFTSMSTGDVFMLRKQDVNIVPHRPLQIVPKDSGRDSVKYALYTGIQCYVDNPHLNGKMTSKD